MKTTISTPDKLPADSPAIEHDRTLIRQVVADAERFQNDPGNFVQLPADDTHLVNVAGYRVEGKDEIYRIMSEAVKTSLAEIKTSHELTDIQFLKNDVALAKCIKHIHLKKEDQPEDDSRAVLTFVMVKNNGRWLISSAQNTLVKEQAIQNIKEQGVRSAEKHMTGIKTG